MISGDRVCPCLIVMGQTAVADIDIVSHIAGAVICLDMDSVTVILHITG